jgi:hypothetical protein
MATDSRIIPIAEIRVARPGQGDPVVEDWGMRWYDILQASALDGTISNDTSGQPTLELVDHIGLVCRPFLVQQDTRLTNYTVSPSSNSWEERQLTTGAPRKYRLVQYDTTAGIQWSAQSNFSLPSDPQVAFSLGLLDTPADWDATTYPPYVQIEFGNGAWAIVITQAGPAALCALDTSSGYYVPVMDLPRLPDTSEVGSQESLIILRVLRGRICISVDGGANYAIYGYADGSSITVASSKYTVRGQGGSLVFGLHQLYYKSGTYTSVSRQGFGARATGSSPTITGSYYLPTGAGLSFSDQGVNASGLARYRASFTAGSSAGTPFTFYRTPELYAVKTVYGLTSRFFSGLGFYTLPLDATVLSVDIDKPLELDGARCTIVARKDAATQPTGLGRWAKVQVILGELDSGGSTIRSTTAFVGYLEAESAEQAEYGKAKITLKLENPTVRLKRMQWGILGPTSTPLGGQTVNAALDECLVQAGLTTTYRSWNSAGDSITIPLGLPENPNFWPKASDSIWDTMTAIAELAGLEIGVTDSGVYFTQVVDYYDGYVSTLLEATASGDIRYGVTAGSYQVNYRESGTRVVVRGEDAYGREAYVYAVDASAELNTLAAAFCPWPEGVVSEVDGTLGAGYLAQVARTRFLELYPLKGEAEITTPVNLDLLRRQQVQVSGLYLGFDVYSRWWVATIRHRYRADPSMASCETTVGLRRVY